MLGRRLLVAWSCLGAQRIERPQDLWRHPDPAPLLSGGDEGGEDQRETRPLPREAGDDLRPASALLKRPFQEVGGPDALAMLHREEQGGQALLQVFLQALHGRREPLPKPREQRPPATERRPVVRGQEDLLDQGFQLSLGQAGQLREDVPHLVDLAPLPPHAGEDLADGFREARAAVQKDEKRLPEPSRGQVVQEGDPRIRALPGPQREVEEHRPAVLQQRVGRQDPFLIGGGRSRKYLLTRISGDTKIVAPLHWISDCTSATWSREEPRHEASDQTAGTTGRRGRSGKGSVMRVRVTGGCLKEK